MKREWLWTFAKGLEGVGLIVILLGLLISVESGMRDESMKSMTTEAYGLAIGGGLFFLGWLLERSLGARS